MAYITTPTKAYKENESFGGAENLTNLQAAIETALGTIYTTGLLTIVDTSMYFTAPDASIWSWTITKV